jgi:CubicO group peptidase (beta-lactamase class C family)
MLATDPDLASAAALAPAELSHELALSAKGVASALWVCGASLERLMTPPLCTSDGRVISVAIESQARVVASAGGLRRVAQFSPTRGACVLAEGERSLKHPLAVLPPPAPPRWRPAAPLRAQRACVRSLGAALDAQRDAEHAALIVLHGGRVLIEDYGPGVAPGQPLASWSMGKSMLALVLGRAHALGWFALDEPVQWPGWRGDARTQMRWRDLLQMSSGLDFSARWASDYRASAALPDHERLYSAGLNAYRFASRRGLAHPPGTFGAYKNADPLMLAALLKKRCAQHHQAAARWPQRALFDRLGCDAVTLETDPFGQPLYTGNVYASARTWALLGQLVLDRGQADGETLIRPDYLDFLASPAPGWRGRYWQRAAPAGFDDSTYGGLFWLNRYPAADAWPLPRDAIYMMGWDSQFTFIVPSLALVVVSMRHGRLPRGRAPAREPLAGLLGALHQHLRKRTREAA